MYYCPPIIIKIPFKKLITYIKLLILRSFKALIYVTEYLECCSQKSIASSIDLYKGGIIVDLCRHDV